MHSVKKNKYITYKYNNIEINMISYSHIYTLYFMHLALCIKIDVLLFYFFHTSP